MLKLRLRPFYLPENPRYPLNRRLGGPPQPVRTFRRKKKSLASTGIRNPARPSCSSVTTSTTLRSHVYLRKAKLYKLQFGSLNSDIHIYNLHFSTLFCAVTLARTHARTHTHTHKRASAVRFTHDAEHTDSPFRLRFDGPPPPSACGSRIRTMQVTRNTFRCNNSIVSLKLTSVVETQQFSLDDPLLVQAPDSLSPSSSLAQCVAA